MLNGRSVGLVYSSIMAVPFCTLGWDDVLNGRSVGLVYNSIIAVQYCTH